MSNEASNSRALSRILFLSLVPLAVACGGGQHPEPVEPASSAPPPSPPPPPPPPPLAGVYTGPQSTTVEPAGAHARDGGAPAQPAAEVPGRIEVAEEAGAARLTIIDPSGLAPCVLAATGERPSLTITAGQACNATSGNATMTLTVQEGSARFEEDALTVDFHGTRQIQQRRGGRHETRNSDVTYHFAGHRSAEAASPAPAATEGASDAGVETAPTAH